MTYKEFIIMPQTNINIRMDAELKKQFDSFCSDVGMTMTTAFCIFAKTVVKERKIPFEINNINPLEERIKRIEDGTANLVYHELKEDVQ